MNMKKFAVAILILLLALTAFACNENKGDTETTAPDTTGEATTVAETTTAEGTTTAEEVTTGEETTADTSELKVKTPAVDALAFCKKGPPSTEGTAWAINAKMVVSITSNSMGSTTTTDVEVLLGILIDGSDFSVNLSAVGQNFSVVLVDRTLYIDIGETKYKVVVTDEDIAAIKEILTAMGVDLPTTDLPDLSTVIKLPALRLPDGNMQLHLDNLDEMMKSLTTALPDKAGNIGSTLNSLTMKNLDVVLDMKGEDRFAAVTAMARTETKVAGVAASVEISATVTFDTKSPETVKAPANTDDFTEVTLKDLFGGDDTPDYSDEAALALGLDPAADAYTLSEDPATAAAQLAFINANASHFQGKTVTATGTYAQISLFGETMLTFSIGATEEDAATVIVAAGDGVSLPTDSANVRIVATVSANPETPDLCVLVITAYEAIK